MKQIIAIAWKDALVRFSSRTELLFFIILPVIFTFIIGGGFGGAQRANRDDRVRLLVVDDAHSALSQQLINALAKSGSVRPDVMARVDADSEFSADRAPALLIIPAGFDQVGLSNGLMLDLRAKPNNMSAPIAERSVNMAVSVISVAASAAQQSLSEAERIKPFASVADRQVYYDHALAQAQTAGAESSSAGVEITRPATASYRYNPAAQASAGQLITWVFIPLLGIGTLFAYERQSGTLRRLFVMPVSKAQLLLGTIGGQFLTSLAQMALLIGFGIAVMGLNWGNDLAGLAVMMIATGLCGAAMGTMLGAFVKSARQANGLSIMLGMVMALLGGCWYPQEIIPEGVRTILQIVPTTWAMRGLTDLAARGLGLPAILPSAAILVAFAAVFFVVGIARFRYE